MSVAVIDLGCSNLSSILFALNRLRASYVVTTDADEISAADRVILPGVGSAKYAMDKINALSLRTALTELDQPLLGVCLGMQLLYDYSFEGDTACLGLLSGQVKKLSPPPKAPWPHVGWSKLYLSQKTNDSRLLYGVDNGAYVYFVHGYGCPVDSSTIATAQYGEEFSAALERNLIFGCQFHPELSSTAGAQILENFLEVPC